jgi:hypothetical protein
LCETGHTLKEAANILRFKAESNTTISKRQANKTDENRVKVEESEEDGWKALLGHLAEEVRDLAERVRILEARVLAKEGQMAWWERWRDLKIS